MGAGETRGWGRTLFGGKSPATGDADAVVERSRQLVEQRRYQENNDLLWVAAREHPDNAEIAVRLSHALAARQGKAEVAVEWADRAANLAPNDPKILWLSAETLFRAGRIEEARARLKEVHAAGDESFPYAVDFLHLVGLVQWKRGKLDKAEEGLRAAFEEAPETPGFATDLVRFFEEQGRSQEAAQVAQVGLRHFPEDEFLARHRTGAES